MSKFPKKVFGGALATAAAVVTMGAPAFAAHTVTPNSGLTDNQQVSVSVTGLPAGGTATILQCNNDQGADFSPAADCAFLSLRGLNLDGAGAGTLTDFVVKKEPVGYADGDLDWKCDTNGSATGDVIVDGPAGPSRVFSTCQIRVVSGAYTAADNESFRPFSFAQAPDPVVPEAPFAALLPVGAVAVLAGGYLIVRNRKPALNI